MNKPDKELSADLRLINLTETDLEKSIYRIFPIKRLIELFTDKKLYMPQVNSWEDVYENFFLKSNFLIDGKEVVGLKEDSELYFGQCWSLIEDSDAMWRIYSQDKKSVRVKTTIRKLFDAVASIENCGVSLDSGYGIIMDTFIGAVNYKSREELNVWAKNQIIKKENFHPNIIESLFIKRDSFRHESEVRIIYCAEESETKIEHDSPVPLIGFSVNPYEFIKEIAFDPRADDSFIIAYKDIFIKTISFPENRIIKSKLYDLDPLTFIFK